MLPEPETSTINNVLCMICCTDQWHHVEPHGLCTCLRCHRAANDDGKHAASAGDDDDTNVAVSILTPGLTSERALRVEAAMAFHEALPCGSAFVEYVSGVRLLASAPTTKTTATDSNDDSNTILDDNGNGGTLRDTQQVLATSTPVIKDILNDANNGDKQGGEQPRARVSSGDHGAPDRHGKDDKIRVKTMTAVDKTNCKNGPIAPHNGTSPIAKTPCKFHPSRRCNRGDHCMFAHLPSAATPTAPKSKRKPCANGVPTGLLWQPCHMSIHTDTNNTKQDNTNKASTKVSGTTGNVIVAPGDDGVLRRAAAKAKAKSKLHIGAVPGVWTIVNSSLANRHTHLRTEEWATAHTRHTQHTAQSITGP